MDETHDDLERDKEAAAAGRPERGRRLWSCLFVLVFTLGGGVGGAIVAYRRIWGSWRGCEDELGVGGGLGLDLLGVAALIVMPWVAVVVSGMALAVNGQLRRSTRWRKFSHIAPALITVIGVVTLIMWIAVWVDIGKPPAGSVCLRTRS